MPIKEKPAARVMTLIVTLKFLLFLKRYGQFRKNMNGKRDAGFKCKISTRLGVETPMKLVQPYTMWLSKRKKFKHFSFSNDQYNFTRNW